MKIAPPTIEVLEARIAPAGLLIAANGHSATFSDVDGDHVKVTVSKGALAAADFQLTTMGAGSQFDELLLSDPGFSGASVTISVTKDTATHGDGLVAVGSIDAGTNNLGAVSIKGDLGFIDAGSGGTAVAVKSLTVTSIGRYEAESNTLLTSTIAGTLDSLVIKGDMDGTDFTASQNIGSVSIGGSLVGGDNSSDGFIYAGHDLGKVSIQHDLRGGLGADSGQISAGNDLGAVTIGGSIYGGPGTYSGSVGGYANVTSVAVAGSVIGGTGGNSGDIFASYMNAGVIGKVTIGGSLTGGDGQDSGVVGGSPAAGGGQSVSLTKVIIGEDIIGGAGDFSGAVSAYNGSLGRLTLKGSLIGGSTNATRAGSIYSEVATGTISISGSVYGGCGTESGFVDCFGIDRITIGGSLYGGSGNYSGTVYSLGTLGLLDIRGDVRGGSGNESGAVTASSGITAQTIGGAIIPGTGTDSGTVA